MLWALLLSLKQLKDNGNVDENFTSNYNLALSCKAVATRAIFC